MTKCETFKLYRAQGTNLQRCPYEKYCKGSECLILGTDSKLQTKEDWQQEAAILTWQINSKRRN